MGAHILWGNDADELQRTPIDYWKLSFPLQLLPDIVTWTTASLPAGCAKATEEEILAVFGILYSLTRTSEGRRDLWSTEDGLFPAPRFGERYSLPRNRFEVLLRCLSFCPPSEAKGNDKWAPVRRLIDGSMSDECRKFIQDGSYTLMSQYHHSEGKMEISAPCNTH